MRLIPLAKYDHKTMQLAEPIYDGKRRILLGKGQIIHPKYKDRLLMLGISNIIVEDAESKGITLEDMLDMPTWLDAIQGVNETFDKVKEDHPIPLAMIQKVVSSVVYEVKRRRVISLVPSTSLAKELELYAHSVNVTLLAVQTGKHLGYNDLQLRDLALGSLLHDLGKVKTDNEEEHPQAGFEILRKNREINLLAAHVAFQHHEQLDGKGYPRQLKGDKFLEYAQICGVANLYENLISKKNIPPHIAIEMIMTLHGITYNERVVKAFVQGIPSYPPGTKVVLHTGESAIVTKIDSYIHRPIVRILSTEQEISLVDHPSLMITGTE